MNLQQFGVFFPFSSFLSLSLPLSPPLCLPPSWLCFASLQWAFTAGGSSALEEPPQSLCYCHSEALWKCLTSLTLPETEAIYLEMSFFFPPLKQRTYL